MVTSMETSTSSTASTGHKKRSPVWQHFVEAENEQYAICKHCKQEVPRGGKNRKSYNTTNLIIHLKSDHRDHYKKFCDDKESAVARRVSNKDQGLKQLTIEGANDKTQQWGIHDARSERVHRKLGEMIATDCQP